MHLYSLCQTWLNLKTHTVSESWGAMRQRILGSHTPPCHRRMVITTQLAGGGGACHPWPAAQGTVEKKFSIRTYMSKHSYAALLTCPCCHPSNQVRKTPCTAGCVGDHLRRMATCSRCRNFCGFCWRFDTFAIRPLLLFYLFVEWRGRVQGGWPG